MLPRGMRHSKETDVQLQQEAIQRAYADPSTFHIEGEKVPVNPYVEELVEYSQMLKWSYIWKGIGLIVFAVALTAACWGIFWVINWWEIKRAYYKEHPQDCTGGVLSLMCAERETIKGGLK